MDKNRFGRRGLLVGALGTAGGFAGSAGTADGNGPSASRPDGRRQAAFRLRRDAATANRDLPIETKPTNGDEKAYASRLNSFSKGLPHNNLGEVDAQAYESLRNAINSGRDADFEAVPMGGAIRLVNPQAADTFCPEGCDPHQPALPAPPAFHSNTQAAEGVELYWRALLRDVPFAEYGNSALVKKAVDDLNRLSDYRGPKTGGRVTVETLFRGASYGDAQGPIISQLLYKPIPYGATSIPQRYRALQPAVDYLSTLDEVVALQSGRAAVRPATFEEVPRYIRNLRDLASYVYLDFTYQAFLNASLILLGYGRTAWNETNPYLNSRTRAAFSSFGGPMVLDLIARVANAALHAAWYQKWQLHMRARPEVFSARVHQRMIKAADYPVHAELLQSDALQTTFSERGSYLLPQAYPEGSPAHPSYPAGHAAISGACATVIKAFFKDWMVFPDPVEASPDGLSLQSYGGAPLILGGEIDKLASNIAFGRDSAGIHYRSDGAEGIVLGEAVAITILRDTLQTFSEDACCFRFRRFDGREVQICRDVCIG